MGRKPRSDTIKRQWEVLRLLPAKGAGRSVAELQAALAGLGHDVGKRTVQRDLEILSSLFRLECNDKSIPHGWRWAAGAQANLPALSDSSAPRLDCEPRYLEFLPPAVKPRIRDAFSAYG